MLRKYKLTCDLISPAELLSREWFLPHTPHSLGTEGAVESSPPSTGTFLNYSSAPWKFMLSIYTTSPCYCLCWLNGCFPILWSFSSGFFSSLNRIPPPTHTHIHTHLPSVPVALTSTRWPTHQQDFLVPWPPRPRDLFFHFTSAVHSHHHPYPISCHCINSEICISTIPLHSPVALFPAHWIWRFSCKIPSNS